MHLVIHTISFIVLASNEVAQVCFYKIEKGSAESFELISLVIYNTVRVCSIVKGLLVFVFRN